MSTGNQFDTTFIYRLAQGDQKAFEMLFNQKHQQVYAYCLKLIKSEVLTEEVMQDVFLTVWKKRDRIDPDRSLDALLYKITRDLSFNCLKRSARELKFRQEMQAKVCLPVDSPAEDKMIEEEYEKLADGAINSLSPRRRLIFTMSRQMGMSYEEIAIKLGISKNTVKVQLVKASKSLREYVATHADITLFLLLSLFFKD